MKHFFQIDIVTEPPLDDESAAFLWIFQPEGINFEDNTTILFFNELATETIDEIKTEFNRLVDDGFVEKFDLHISKKEQKNWNEEWQKNLKVIKSGTKFAIKPTFVDYTEEEGEIVIEIDPKMSFGTGEHETTQLILGLIERYALNKNFVLDAGAGTAILAIGSIKLGAKKAIAYDYDDWCLENGLENVKLNNVEDFVEIRICETKDIRERDFDLILANIQRDVLIEIANQLSERQQKNGILILSGLLITDEEIILPIYTNLGYKLLEKAGKNEWISLVFEYYSS
jgi:ribosomal protein L11 methyltransferase